MFEKPKSRSRLLLGAGIFAVSLCCYLAAPTLIYAEEEHLLKNLVLSEISEVFAMDSQLVDGLGGALDKVEVGSSWQAPLTGVITSPFGDRGSGFHHGVDIADDWGTPIRAIAGGTVTEADWKNAVYGYAVSIDHGNGWQSLSAHCSMLTVKPGQTVEQGDVIALVGSTGNSTGPHLHLELRKDGVLLDAAELMELEE